MKLAPNPWPEGSQVILTAGDSLDDVPESHRAILTPAARAVFADPHGYFAEIADLPSFPTFRNWLRTELRKNWYLILCDHDGDSRSTELQFAWGDDLDRAVAWFIPGELRPDEYCSHPDLRPLFRGLRSIRWWWPDFAGFFGPGDWLTVRDAMFRWYPLSMGGLRKELPNFPLDESYVLVNTSRRDDIIHNAAGQTAFVSYETGAAYRLGEIVDTVEWIFAELSAFREPRFDDRRETL